jgi:alpha-beta hydrolase superfamily lysophospholipase
MEHCEKKWKSFDGLSIFSQTWNPAGIPKAVINLVHGLGEHSSRYTGWAEKFTDRGYTVRSFDMRGHGNSDGKRGYSSSYNNLIVDISDFIHSGKVEYPSLPTFLYGHSLGGNLVLNYAIQNIPDVNGMIVTSPWLELVNKPSPAIYSILSVLGRFLPALQVSNGLKIEDLSRNKRVVQEYKDDPLVHERITLGLGLQIFEAGSKVTTSIHKINVPMLIMHGSSDNITSCRATYNFVRHAGDKTKYIEWEGGFHELHNDLDREKVFESIVEWLDSKI